MIWKALFDAQSAHWYACGRVVFVEADSREDADRLAREAATREFPGMAFPVWDIAISTEHARAVFEDKKERVRVWLERAARGERNDRSVLP